MTRKFFRHWQALAGSATAQAALVVVAVLVAKPVLSEVSRYFYYLPAGARFAALLLIPRRLWAALILAEMFTRAVGAMSYSSPVLAAVIIAVLPPLAGPLAVRWYVQTMSTDLGSTRGMGRLLAGT